jgi:hypothetical protein
MPNTSRNSRDRSLLPIKKRFISLLMLFALLGGASPIAFAPYATAQADAQPIATADVVPEDALIYVTTYLDAESSQYLQAQNLLNRAGYAGSVDDVIAGVFSLFGDTVGTMRDLTALSGSEIGLAITDLDLVSSLPVDDFLAGGEIGDDFFDFEADAGSGAVMIVRPDDLAVALEWIQLQRQASQARGLAQIEETEYNNVSIFTQPGDSFSESTGYSYAFTNGYLLLAAAAFELHPFIDVVQGQAAPLSQSDDFQEVLAALPGDRLAFGYWDGSGFASALGDIGSGFGLPGLGTDGTTNTLATGSIIVAEQAGFRFEGVELPVEGTEREAAGEAADLTFSERIPDSSALMVNGFDVGSSLALQTLAQTLAGFIGMAVDLQPGEAATPGAVDLESQYLLLSLLLGFHIQDDFLAQLSGEYGFALTNIDLNDPTQIEALLVSEVQDPERVGLAIGNLSPLLTSIGAGVSVTSRLIDGDTVTTVGVPLDGLAAVTVEYGVVEQELLVGVGEAIDAYLDGPTSSLAADPGYQQALSLLPDEYDGVFFVNVSTLMEVAQEGGDLADAIGVGGLVAEDSRCAEFASAEEAQAAYDEDPIANFDLDPNFDGQACEEYFSEQTGGFATPVAAYDRLGDFALVSHKDNGLARTSGILVIEE